MSDNVVSLPRRPLSVDDVRALEAQTPPPGLRLVLVADGLFDNAEFRDNDGRRLKVDWDGPDEHGWYTLAFYVDPENALYESPWSQPELLDIYDRTADRPAIREKIRRVFGAFR